MKATRTTQWIAAMLVIGLATACTDGREMPAEAQLLSTVPTGSYLLPVASISSFQGQPFDVTQMIMTPQGSLFLTGSQIGFSRWETAQDPENPTMTFSSTNQMSNFAAPVNQYWILPDFTGGALAIWGNYAVTSGSVGASIIGLTAGGSTAFPEALQLYPPGFDPTSSPMQVDAAYVYSALVPHPTLPIAYGFSTQDALYEVSLNSAGLQVVSQTQYGAGGQAVCCNLGATIFNGSVYAAFTNQLLFWNVGSNGGLVNPKYAPELDAVNVVATSRYLYVQHNPTGAPSQGTQYPAGIYVFDVNGNCVTYFSASNPQRFAVSPDDSHLYANIDGASVQIFRINWTN